MNTEQAYSRSTSTILRDCRCLCHWRAMLRHYSDGRLSVQEDNPACGRRRKLRTPHQPDAAEAMWERVVRDHERTCPKARRLLAEADAS